MDFDSYTGAPVTLAVDLVNSESTITGNDTLADLAAARTFLAAHDVTRELREADVARLRALRARLREVFTAGDDTVAGQRINALLVEHHATPRVSWHGGPLHMHFESTTADAVDYVGASAAMGLAVVLCDHGAARFGCCGRPDCADVYVDTSKNRTKRYCGEGCARRASVAAFRERARAARA